MKKLLLLVSVLLSIFIRNNTYAQIDDSNNGCLFQEECVFDYTDSLFRNMIYDSRNGYSLSPHGSIRLLLIFVELEYDNPDNDPYLTGSDYWDIDTLPKWANQLYDTNIPVGISEKSVTKYFQYASSNDHIVLGDYLLAPDNYGVFKIRTSDGNMRPKVNDIIDSINLKLGNNIITAANKTFADFDMWTPSNPGCIKTPSGNNKWDFVAIVMRNSNNPNNPNGGGVNITHQLLGHYIDKGCIVCAGDIALPDKILRHEYAHKLMGNNNTHTCGGGWSHTFNYWIPQTGGWALMGLYSSSLMCWSAWDRYRLGWKTADYDISARSEDGLTEINGDLNCSNGNEIYILRDFVTTGDAIRIKLPFIKKGLEYQEWLWIENHQGVTNNNVEFDQWQYQHKSCVDNFRPGLMAYIQIGNEIRESSVADSIFEIDYFADYLNPLVANGNWDRDHMLIPVQNNCVNNETVKPFIRYAENPLTGCGDQNHDSYDNDGDNTIDKNDQLKNWIELNGSIYLKNLFQLGHGTHSFTLNGNNKIGISTNPSSASLINMVGEDNQYLSAKNLRTTYLNGISVEILDQHKNGNIKVRIRFDDIDIDNDVRWCSDSIVLNDIQTESGYSMNIKEGKSIILDQGLTATRMTNPITVCGKKVFASPTTFTIQPNVKIHLEQSARIVLENASKLHFRDSVKCVVEDTAIIEIKDGTVFQMDECSSLIINGRGKLIVKRGAELRISPNASLAFQNGVHNLIMETGVIINNGYANPYNMIQNTISNLNIVDNNTWTNVNLKVYGKLVVDAGAVLNIVSSNLSFVDKDGAIIIKQGGKLIVDNTVLKSAMTCNETWSGIQVWGNSNEPQYPYNGTYKQGVLELKNGAVIENAVCAVELWRPGYWNTTGGIVFADDAVFRNNAKSVHALYYTNHHPVNNVELPYISYFRNCEFVIDTNYLGTETFYKHVDLSHVNGIGFQGCDFQATRGIPGVAPKCMGIGAYSAGFMVDSRCESVSMPCPENDIDRCTFTGFNYGVLSVNDGNDFRSFTVRDAVFTNNRRGVYAQNTGYATILNNSFNIGNDSVCSYGVYAEGVSGFCIEENLFVPVNGVKCTTYGIGIFNSTGVNDIYKNTFRNLSCGNLAYGRNTSSSEEPQNKDFVGLTYTCNENIYNEYDFCVLKDNGTGDIATYQGSSAIPAGNTFSGSLFHFYNDGEHQVHYYYNSNASDEIPNTQMLSSVTPHATTSSNDCYSHYVPGGVRKTDEEIDALENAYGSADSICSVLKNIYNNVNAGDSTALMSQMAHYAHERAMAAGDIIRSDLNDTVADLARIRLWLGRMNDLASDRMVVSTYVHEGDFSSAMALANTFPRVYKLQGGDLLDHYDYMALLDLYRTLYNSGRNVYELTSDELAMVTDLADRGQGTSRMMAEAIMMEISDRSTTSYICPDLPVGTMDRGVKPSSLNQTDESDAIIVNVIPSPATTWVNVEYKLPEKHYDAVMTIVNMLGFKVKTVELSGTQGIITVDLRDLPAGIYGYTVRSGDYQKAGRMIITK